MSPLVASPAPGTAASNTFTKLCTIVTGTPGEVSDGHDAVKMRVSADHDMLVQVDV